MSEPTTDDVTTWRAAYLSLLGSWTALCDLAGVDGDSAPAEVLTALRRAERERFAAGVRDCRATENVPEFRAAVLALITPKDQA